MVEEPQESRRADPDLRLGLDRPSLFPLGMQIRTTGAMVVRDGEDWSRVRSPARARRRLRQGHPQNIAPRFVPDPSVVVLDDTLVMHPATYAKLRGFLELAR